MKPQKLKQREQNGIFRSRLDQILGRQHPLYRFAHQIDWSVFDKSSVPYYAEQGRLGESTRLLVGLHHLKHVSTKAMNQLSLDCWRIPIGSISEDLSTSSNVFPWPLVL